MVGGEWEKSNERKELEKNIYIFIYDHFDFNTTADVNE